MALFDGLQSKLANSLGVQDQSGGNNGLLAPLAQKFRDVSGVSGLQKGVGDARSDLWNKALKRPTRGQGPKGRGKTSRPLPPSNPSPLSPPQGKPVAQPGANLGSPAVGGPMQTPPLPTMGGGNLNTPQIGGNMPQQPPPELQQPPLPNTPSPIPQLPYFNPRLDLSKPVLNKPDVGLGGYGNWGG